MKKTISVKEFADELVRRLNNGKTVDCCKEELVNLASIVKREIPDHPIEVEWKE